MVFVLFSSGDEMINYHNIYREYVILLNASRHSKNNNDNYICNNDKHGDQSMKTLSYTQEYFLCAMNSKANTPFSLNAAFPACLVVGGIMELLNGGYIVRMGKDRLVGVKDWDDGLPYLKPLYDTIMTLRRINDAKGIIGVYTSILSQQRFDDLYSAIGVSLVESGCADDMVKYGLSKKKTKYIPKAEAVKAVIHRVHSEFIEVGALSEGTLNLAAFLDKSLLFRSYFSRVEAEILKKRIEEVQQCEAYAFVSTILNYSDGSEVAAMYFG